MGGATNSPVGAGTERELKFAAWPGFELPDLASVAPGLSVVPRSELDLDAVYFDTEDLRLARRSVTLRRRTGEDGPRWTLKLPKASSPDGVLLRRELDVEDEAEHPPAALVGLVTAYVRSTRLRPVAHLRTRRRRLRLSDLHGRVLGEIDDDEVSVLVGEHVAARFREVELELTSAASTDLVTLISAVLVDSGAGAPDPTPKLVRAIGPRALAPPELAPVEVDAQASMGELLSASLISAARQVIENEHVVRLDDDVEGVHQVRVGTRRLRSNLRTFRRVVDESWAGALREELSWWSASLGQVRDADVLSVRLWADVDALGSADRANGALVLRRLQDERRSLVESLLADMSTERHVRLLDRVVDAAYHPKLTREARRKAIEIVPAIVRRRWKRLRAAVDALGPVPSDDELHAIRMLAKRVRYAVEAAQPVTGPEARAFAKALAHVQDVLGDLHDTAVAQAWLRDVAMSLPRAQAVVAGELIARQHDEAKELRATWPAAWTALDRKRLTGWML